MQKAMPWKRLLPLIVVLAIYLCLGALLFKFIEGDPEIQRRHDLREMLTNFIDKHNISRDHLIEFIEAIGSEAEFSKGVLQNKSIYTRWDFPGSFSFVVTVATTIGYGNLAPHTELGKMVVIAYALIGIPTTFLMLQGLGEHLAILSKKVNKLKLCSKRPELNKYVNMVLIILIGLSLLFIGPTFLFMNVEGWSMMDGIYYCFVTLSTIGFGDFIPEVYPRRNIGIVTSFFRSKPYVDGTYKNRLTETIPMSTNNIGFALHSANSFSGELEGTIYRIVAYVWILFGLAYLALIINYISMVLVKKAEKVQKMSKAKLEAEMKTLQRELVKQKSNFLTIANNVAESVSSGMDVVRKSQSEERHLDSTPENPDVVIERDTPSSDQSVKSIPRSPFKYRYHKKQEKEKEKIQPVVLLSYTRRGSL